jgi:hypothetical protein
MRFVSQRRRAPLGPVSNEKAKDMYRVLIGALLMVGIALSGGAVGSSGKLPAFPEDPKSHHWEKLGTGVYAFISPIGITPIVSGNSLVVIGR